MGTRNLTMVIKTKKVRVAQYGQWDGYPSGQGTTILNFLRTCDMDKFKKKIQTGVRFRNSTDTKERADFLKKIGSNDGWLNMEQAGKYNAKFPYDSRDYGGQILELIYDAPEKVVLGDSRDFGKDSLFCEWAYCVNLDTMKLEVYEGFQKSPAETAHPIFGNERNKNGYYPVKMIQEFDLNNLPTEDEFLAILEPAEKENED